ncbi:MAG TPA: protein kinase [Polyangiales bacterium]
MEEDPAEKTLTRAGEMMGTPAYMSPEQVAGDPAEPSTDVYAMGVILFEMLAGRKPFEGDPADMLRAHLTQPVPRLAELQPSVAVCGELEALLQRAMAKKPKERFQDAAEMLRALELIPQPWIQSGAAPASHVSDTFSAAPTVLSARGAADLQESVGARDAERSARRAQSDHGGRIRQRARDHALAQVQLGPSRRRSRSLAACAAVSQPPLARGCHRPIQRCVSARNDAHALARLRALRARIASD